MFAIALAAWHWWPRDQTVVISSQSKVVGAEKGEADASSLSGAQQSEDSTGTVCVHVAGAVKYPAVYTLPAGARVISAIEAAGGLLPGAAQAGINLAAELTDGEQVIVLTQEEFAQSGGISSTGVSSDGKSVGAGAGKPVNINTADSAMLDTLPGVGPATAAKIIADREANGPFKSTADLGRVSGFGDKRLAQLEGLICVR